MSLQRSKIIPPWALVLSTVRTRDKDDGQVNTALCCNVIVLKYHGAAVLMHEYI